MSLKKEENGRRSVQVEVEVPGTPEEVWQAIATGPGVSCWFVPCEVEERLGGTVTSHFGPGMDSVSKITAWDAPHRFAEESANLGPNAPSMATEWTVEARGGEKCVVRVVHSLFASTDDWDEQLTSVESGWPAFFRILRLDLEHFRGQPSAGVQLMAMAAGDVRAAWDALTGPLGLAGAAVGERRASGAEGPPIAGVVEAVLEGPHPYVLLLVDRPAAGAAYLGACPAGEQVYLAVNFYFYGAGAADAAAREEGVWKEWLSARFPG